MSELARGQQDFCCPGCETAYAIISGGGWQAYYQVRERELARPVDPASLSFGYLQTDDYQKSYTRSEGTERTTTWFLEGLRCGACSWLVEQVARNHAGIREATLYFAEARLDLRFEEQANLEALATQLGQLGYVVGLVPHSGSARPKTALRLGITGALAANLMLMSLPFYVGLSDGNIGFVFGLLSFLLSLPLLIYSGREYFVRAYTALRLRLPGLDLPIALGLAGGFLLSTYNLMLGHYHGLYFDSMGMLLFFLLLGKTARETGITRALHEGRRLLARMPQLVDTLRPQGWVALPAAQLVPGDLMRLRNGDVLALDAELVSDEATLNLHVVSGEAEPITRLRGAELLAGSINLGSLIELRAKSSFNDSRFALLEQTAHGLQERKAHHGSGRAAWLFLACALGAACLAAAVGWQVSPLHGLSSALTVLIVVCPCALALSRPLADAFALRQAALMGTWIKDCEVLQLLPRIRNIIFDKTGVLTDGEPRIVHSMFFHGSRHWMEAAIAALEAQVHHPLVAAFAQTQGPRVSIGSVTQVHVLPGAGLSGYVEGRHLIVSSPSRLAEFKVSPEVCAAMLAHAETMPDYLTQVAVVLDQEAGALFGLADPIRPEVTTLVKQLHERQLTQTLLSGDRLPAVAHVAETVGIDLCHGNMRPEQKLNYVQKHQPDATLMVGDGFNDMGALARAAVGVTHAQGSEAALRFANVIFRDRDMSRLAALFHLAETTRLAVGLGILLSLLYNLLAVVLAVRGTIGPLGAALLMPLSSLSLLGLLALVFSWRHTRWAS